MILKKMQQFCPMIYSQKMNILLLTNFHWSHKIQLRPLLCFLSPLKGQKCKKESEKMSNSLREWMKVSEIRLNPICCSMRIHLVVCYGCVNPYNKQSYIFYLDFISTFLLLRPEDEAQILEFSNIYSDRSLSSHIWNCRILLHPHLPSEKF